MMLYSGEMGENLEKGFVFTNPGGNPRWVTHWEAGKICIHLNMQQLNEFYIYFAVLWAWGFGQDCEYCRSFLSPVISYDKTEHRNKTQSTYAASACFLPEKYFLDVLFKETGKVEDRSSRPRKLVQQMKNTPRLFPFEIGRCAAVPSAQNWQKLSQPRYTGQDWSAGMSCSQK